MSEHARPGGYPLIKPARLLLGARSFGLAAPLVAVVGMVVWALDKPHIVVPHAPPEAPFVLAGITFATTFIARWSQTRFGITDRAGLLLPDPIYTLYLASVVLVGVPAAVLIAVLTPLLESLVALPGDLHQAITGLRRSAAAAFSTLVAGLVYLSTAALLSHAVSSLRARFAGAIIATVIMFLGASGARGIEQRLALGSFGLSLREYISSPALRFQALLLSVGPLLPLADLLDDAEAEFAWVLFLVPLCAVYYLALVSVRLQQRTDELQVTVEELRKSRRREAELSDYAALITRAQEDERRRLARELHDDTAQALIALSRGLDALAARPVHPPLSSGDARFVGELGELSKRTLDGVRRACQDLRPSVLDDLGLPAALESLAHAMTMRGMTCTFHQTGDRDSYPPEVEVTVYRIAQEALSNVRQHARPRTTSLDVSYQASCLQLRIADDGCGFDSTALVREHTFAGGATEVRGELGLLGMRERASLIGAQLSIESVVGIGTTVALSVPRHRADVPVQ